MSLGSTRALHPHAEMRHIGLMALMTLVLAVACGSPTEVGNAVPLTLQVSATSGMPGDTIRLTGIAHNPTNAVILAGRGCEPGIAFYVTDPTGRFGSLYDGLAFNCPVLDSQELGPNETDSVTWLWTVPDTAGSYQVRAALEFRDGQLSLSAPTPFLVQ